MVVKRVRETEDMDDDNITPHKDHISTPLSKFEESPVFSYISSLSPIQQAKSVHITQSINPLSFASIPSVFTSPQVSSVRDTKVLRRHQFHPSNSEFSNERGSKTIVPDGQVNASDNSSELGNFESATSTAESCIRLSYVSSKLRTDVSGILSNDCVTPAAENIFEMASTSATVMTFLENDPGNGPSGKQKTEPNNSDVFNKKSGGCDFYNLISDASDLLCFRSPNKDTESSKGPGENLVDSTKFAGKPCSVDVVISVGNPLQKEVTDDQEIFSRNVLDGCLNGKTASNTQNEVDLNMHRGIRRRCLVFDGVGACKKHLNDGSVSGSLQSSKHRESDKKLAPANTEIHYFPCKLPAIGLHLNALATTSTNHKVAKQYPLASSPQLLIGPSPAASKQSHTTGQETSHLSSGVTSSESGLAIVQNGVLFAEDALQPNGLTDNNELEQSSPRKKRQVCAATKDSDAIGQENSRLSSGVTALERGVTTYAEDALQPTGFIDYKVLKQSSPKKKRFKVKHEESQGCKHCNCKKSKCLKLYCECFAASLFCADSCFCQECFNKPIHKDTVLETRKQIESRDPLAFAPKVTMTPRPDLGAVDDLCKTPASARHKRGCNCKKSGCQKKYCECYQAGVGCSISCRCDGCKNIFGRRNGFEEYLHYDEVDVCERNAILIRSEKTSTVKEAEQNSATPETPLRFCRSNQLPTSSKDKPPQSFPTIGSSRTFSWLTFGKLNPIDGPEKFRRHLKSASENEIPDILQGNDSPISGVKSASPNSKRVSPPHINKGISPLPKSARKLILQSIPSFSVNSPKD